MVHALTPADADAIFDEAVQMVIRERERQVIEKGHTADHDDQHDNEELAAAAAFFLLPQYMNQDVCACTTDGEMQVQPLHELIAGGAWDGIDCDDYGDDTEAAVDTRVRQLAKGVALGIAEMERWLRARRRRELCEQETDQ